jgi:hypothetical protein
MQIRPTIHAHDLPASGGVVTLPASGGVVTLPASGGVVIGLILVIPR